MPCYHPLKGYRSQEVNPETGKRSIVFNSKYGFIDMPVNIPCGKCIGCRLEKSRQWAVRCVHEASLYKKNCFITLTYNDQHLPKNNSLSVEDFQKFMKRLRKKYYDQKIRFFHCGEYGSKNSRPHYHALLFNFDFDDKLHWKTHRGQKYYISKSLQNLWSDKTGEIGFTTIGDITFESAAYVARYIIKKQYGKDSVNHYENKDANGETIFDSRTGEISERKPEYVTMSRRPGIASDWFNKFKNDVYPNDYIVLRGKIMRPPKYYDNIFEDIDKEEYDKVMFRRKKHMESKDVDYRRLSDIEKVKLRKTKLLKRSYEDEE